MREHNAAEAIAACLDSLRTTDWCLLSVGDEPAALACGIQGDRQWMDVDPGQPLAQAAVIDGPHAYLRGVWCDAMLRMPPGRAVAEVMGDRWLRCRTEQYVRTVGPDSTVLGQLGKWLDPVDAEVVGDTEDGASRILTVFAPEGLEPNTWDIELATDGARLRRARHPNGSVACVLEYDPAAVERRIPARRIYEDDYIDVDEVRRAVKDHGRPRPRTRSGKNARPPLELTVLEPAEGESEWVIRSTDILQALGVPHGTAAENWVAEVLSAHEPELATAVSYDSEASEMFLYCPSKELADRVAQVILGELDPRRRVGGPDARR